LSRIARHLTGALALCASACGPSPAPSSGPSPEPGPRREPERIEVLSYTPLTTGLPAIPVVDGALDIQVIQPSAGSGRPRVDSTAVYGSVGTGGAGLAINGTPVPVAPNGAFIAFLPVPTDGVWRFQAQRGADRDTLTLAYRSGGGGDAPPTASRALSPALPLTVRGGDTLATGSDAPYARPTPTGTYRWFFPAGARLSAVEQRGGQYRVMLDGATPAWIDTAAVSPGEPVAAAGPLGRVAYRSTAEWTELSIPAGYRPFRVQADSTRWTVTVYGIAATPATEAFREAMLSEVAVAPAGGSTELSLRFGVQPWGYKVFYDSDGDLVLRIRRPPRIDPAAPLRGRRIMIDPGHPPAGATGPTGLRESEANLAIALPLAERLRAAGAEVLLTRTTHVEVGLAERTRMAVSADAELLVSVHNNAFGEGQNPFRAFHTTVYYFHPLSAELARLLDREIVTVTGLRDLGARAENLALVRPTWMPSALTESVFMPIPEQENALRDAGFVARLAEAHARGIEAYFRARAGH
jgi:N-acetylmuramoyl-L-alanine amidase